MTAVMLLATTQRKEKYYVMDNQLDPDSAMAVRYGFIVYHGRSNPHSARNCHNSSADKRNSRAKGHLEWHNLC